MHTKAITELEHGHNQKWSARHIDHQEQLTVLEKQLAVSEAKVKKQHAELKEYQDNASRVDKKVIKSQEMSQQANEESQRVHLANLQLKSNVTNLEENNKIQLMELDELNSKNAAQVDQLKMLEKKHVTENLRSKQIVEDLRLELSAEKEKLKTIAARFDEQAKVCQDRHVNIDAVPKTVPESDGDVLRVSELEASLVTKDKEIAVLQQTVHRECLERISLLDRLKASTKLDRAAKVAPDVVDKSNAVSDKNNNAIDSESSTFYEKLRRSSLGKNKKKY